MTLQGGIQNRIWGFERVQHRLEGNCEALKYSKWMSLDGDITPPSIEYFGDNLELFVYIDEFDGFIAIEMKCFVRLDALDIPDEFYVF